MPLIHQLRGTSVLSKMIISSEYSINFVFRRVPPHMRVELLSFWEQHRQDWITTTRQPEARNSFTVKNSPEARSAAIMKNIACVAYHQKGNIAGVAWINVATMPVQSNQPELIYFQRLYITAEHRCARLANQMINTFHDNFRDCNTRSPLIKHLLAENVNPKLKTPAGRRLFIRKGFKFMGFNFIGNEVWKLPLPPTSCPAINTVFH